MEFRILGPLEVVDDDGRPLAIGGAKQRALLAILLLHANQVVSADRLIDNLWGDRPPETVTKALHVYVSQLRKALDGGRKTIVTSPPGYLVRVEPDQLDLDRFEGLADEAGDAWSGGDAAAAAERLGEALDLWRGPALSDFAFEPWAQAEAARLEELRLAALEQRLEAELALGRHAKLVGELDTLVRRHPFRERLRGQLMLALYRAGRQAEALAAYQDARRALVAELGIQPSHTLQKLEREILRQDRVLELPEAVVPATALATDAEEPRPALPPEAAPTTGEERKIVTVVFADFIESISRAEEADPEDVRDMLRPYYARAKQEVERLGGTVEKFAGGPLMAAFGAPVAHEDDAVRAVRAALAIAAAVQELNASHSRPLAVRLGVNTGNAVVDPAARPDLGESMVTGDVVHAALQIQHQAPPGGVVVGEMTHTATQDMFEYETLSPTVVKGRAAPVHVWRAGAQKVYSQDVRPLAPFVGREPDLALLAQTFARTIRESSAQLVTITGEPGVGKTRLVTELRAAVETQAREVLWRRGRCLPYGEGVTFWALGEIVKEHARILESDDPGRAADKLAAIVDVVGPEAAERDWLLAALAPLVGASVVSAVGMDERAETSFTAWRRFLELVATARPLVLVLEDLHWADSALLEFVENVVDHSTDVPILFLATARPELFDRKPGWGGGKRNSTTIGLSPLASAETAQLIASLLGQAVLPEPTQAVLLDRAGGNPLYAEEFVRMLNDRGILRRAGSALELRPDGEILVPENLQALIAARLDTLAPDRKSLLQDAAVIGRTFWSGAVAWMGGIDEDAVQDGLHELARKEFVRAQRGSSVQHQEDYAFWHVLVRDVAYGQIPRAARARKHLAAAAWIENLGGDRVSDHAEFLAHHYVQALELTRALGGETGELEALAHRFLVLAGDRAIQLDVGAAEAYYRRALELLPEETPARPKLLAKTAEAAWLAGRLAEAEETYAEAIAGFRRQGDVLGAGETMVALVASLRDRGETVGARALLEEAVELLERKPPGPELAVAYLHVARDDAVSGRAEATLESAQRAIDLAGGLGLRDHVARALQFRGGGSCELGDLRGVEDLRESLRMTLELGLGYYTVNAYGNLAEQVWRAEGRPAEALELYRAGVDFGRRRGITFKTYWVDAESLWVLFDLGEWDELLKVAERIVAWDDEYGGSQIGIIVRSYRARVLVHRDELVEAAAAGDGFLPAARESGDRQVLAPALAIAALIEQRKGDSQGALRLIEELEEATREYPSWRSHELPDATRICAAAGAVELIERLLSGHAETMARDRNCALTARAVLAELQGEVESAAGLYAEAGERWAEFGSPLERAHALLGAGRCLGPLGRSEDALHALSEARAVFRQLGAGRLAAEAETLTARSAEPASP